MTRARNTSRFHLTIPYFIWRVRYCVLVLCESLWSSLYKKSGELPAVCSWTRKARGPLAATSISAHPPHSSVTQNPAEGSEMGLHYSDWSG